MERVKAIVFEENVICVDSVEELSKLYNLIMEEEDFIIEWKSDDDSYAEVLVSNNIYAKVKTGDMKLSSLEKKGNEK